MATARDAEGTRPSLELREPPAWAVLYTLSMLARYEPAAWGTLINVDNSRFAAPIERLLERAINHLPVLIADAITEVST